MSLTHVSRRQVALNECVCMYLHTTLNVKASSRPEPGMLGFSAWHLRISVSSSGVGVKVTVLIIVVSLPDNSN